MPPFESDSTRSLWRGSGRVAAATESADPVFGRANGSSREPLEAGYMQGPRPMAFPSSGHHEAADLIISSAEAGNGCQNQMLKVGRSP